MFGMFALGLFIGMVGATTALLAFVVVESVETGKDPCFAKATQGLPCIASATQGRGEMMKDCFKKPIKVVSACEIKPGDYIHDIYDPASLLDIEKRKGVVTSAALQIKLGRIALRLIGRKSVLEVPANANTVITGGGE